MDKSTLPLATERGAHRRPYQGGEGGQYLSRQPARPYLCQVQRDVPGRRASNCKKTQMPPNIERREVDDAA